MYIYMMNKTTTTTPDTGSVYVCLLTTPEQVKVVPTPTKQGKGGCPEGVEFSVAEVLKHTKCKFPQGEFDLWLVIDNNVYNVNDWGLWWLSPK
jgi:hypothetical protein